MGNRVAFICPLYDMKNHFDLAINLVRSKLDRGIKDDLYFVFTNESQKTKFEQRVKEELSEEIFSLMLPSDLEHYKSKVSVKKFFALRELMNDYEFIACIDSESIFVKSIDFYNVFDEVWNQGTNLNGNISPDGFFIQRTCFRTLSKDLYNNKILREEFEDYRYNLWFNEIPVYKCSTLPGFFKWLDTFDKEGWMNEWLCFEYYIYAAYLILFEGMHIRKFPDIVSNGGVMEYLFERPKDEQLKIINQLGTHWSSSKDAINERTCILFHLDRPSSDFDYGFGLDEKTIRIFEMQRKKLLRRDVITDKFPFLEYYYKQKDDLRIMLSKLYHSLYTR